MKFLLCATAAAALLMSGGSATAFAKSSQTKQPQQHLRQALNDLALGITAQNGETPPGQVKRPNDPDQGDDNAALRAILTVCTMNTPAAERSAICDGEPITPQ